MDELHAGPRVRNPAVAGLFYPSDAGELRAEVDALLASAPSPTGPAPKGVVAPHAGYVYSGGVAAQAFRALGLRAHEVRRVLLFGPAHRVCLRGLALPDADVLRTPLGDVPVDREACAVARRLPGVDDVALAHAREHSIEVMLPFLQRTLGRFSVVPFVVGEVSPAQVGAVMEALWGGPETAIVVSSDLSHFHAYTDARRRDEATAEAIEGLVDVSPEQACGARPLCGLLWLARRKGLALHRLALLNSGDVRGDREEVVGYGAFRVDEARRSGAPGEGPS